MLSPLRRGSISFAFNKDEIKSYNKNVSRCPSLMITKDNF
jgi:hypothetical protein